MNCPLQNTETAGMLLDYCARKLDAGRAAILERHIELCPACRQFAENQRAVWSALDAWEADAVSPDFDRRLYRRIEADWGWRDRLAQAVRPLFAYRGVPAIAALCLLLITGVWIDRSAKPVPPAGNSDVSVVDVRPEQVEKALDAIDVLSEFNRKVRAEKTESKL